ALRENCDRSSPAIETHRTCVCFPRPGQEPTEGPVYRSRALEAFLEACGATGPIELEVLGANGATPHRHTLDRPFALLGRHRRNELSLKAPEVSPRHAYIQCVLGHLFVVDLDSRGGTRWQGQARRGGWLGQDDVLRIGPFSIRLAPSVI